MTGVNKRALVGLLGLFAAMTALLFVPAWTLRYWQAWVFLSVFFGAALAITVYLMKRDPGLLERRIYAGPTAEKEKSQKIIQSITTLGFVAMLVVPALDHRFAWSAVPLWVTLGGDVVVAIGFLIIFSRVQRKCFCLGDDRGVSRAKSYIERPVRAGAPSDVLGRPFTVRRHVSRARVVVGLLGISLMAPALIWRIFDEEKLLVKELPGYPEYRNTVRRRLIPFVW